jgi:vacuolar-type H+-ATPase subunit C/Vma6
VELANSFYSLRSVLRCRVKQRLLIDPDYAEAIESIDDDLLKELAATLFQTERYHRLIEGCDSAQELANLENTVVAELVATYLTVWQQRSQPIIQQLNSLLSASLPG